MGPTITLQVLDKNRGLGGPQNQTAGSGQKSVFPAMNGILAHVRKFLSSSKRPKLRNFAVCTLLNVNTEP